MRTFVAIAIPDDVCDQLEVIQRGIHAGRMVPRENMHLTLAFLDNQPRGVLSALHEELDAIRVPPFDVHLKGIGAFGKAHPASLHAVALDNSSLSGLQRRVRAAARKAGITIPRRKFVPHVTLARFSAIEADAARAAIAWFLRTGAERDLGVFRVSAFSLYSSQLKPEGPIYHAQAQYPLTYDIPVREGVWAPEDH